MGLTFLFLTFAHILLALCLVSSTKGLKCYECTNEDQGCITSEKEDKGIQLQPDIPSKYQKECSGGAISCFYFEVHYDFLTQSFYHRTCLYESDKACFDLDGPTPTTISTRYKQNIWNYAKGVDCWKKSRSDKDLPPPVLTKRDPPQFNAASFYTIYSPVELGLGNGWYSDFQPLIDPAPTPRDLTCYSCEEEISEYYFDKWGKEDKKPPGCVKTKSIQCKGAYGCAAFWEVREETTKQVSRVWRGCWYPGEMKCFRDAPGATKSSKGRSAKEGSRDGDACKKAYLSTQANSPGYNILVDWNGMKEIDTLQGYGAYLKCVSEIRASKGVEFTSSIKKLEDVKDPDEEEVPFAKVLYYFCSVSNNAECNNGWPRKSVPGWWKPKEKTKRGSGLVTTTTPSCYHRSN